jgi:hypothetical protein
MKRHPIISRIEQDLRRKLRTELNARTAEILKRISDGLEVARDNRELFSLELSFTLEIHPEATQPTP